MTSGLKILFFPSVLMVGSFAAAGCSYLQFSPKKGQTVSPPEVPFTVRVIDDRTEEGRTYVTLGVTAEVELPSDTVALSTVCISQGEAIAEEVRRMDELLSTSAGLPVGSETVIPTVIPGKECEDYQVRLTWGSTVKQSEKAAAKSPLLVTNLLLEEDNEVISAILRNEGKEVVRQIFLEVAFIEPGTSKVDFGVAFAEYSKIVELPPVELLPGEEQKIRLRLGPSPKEGLLPTLRVLSEKPK